MNAFIQYVTCRECGTSNGLRWFRARRFSVALCDECALARPLVNEEGREFRLCAVATDKFVTTQEAA